MKRNELKSRSARYMKLVEWSDDLRVEPALRRRLAAKALAEGESLNPNNGV